jgi:glycosyltransferase involved in cell wall biosynthesis
MVSVHRVLGTWSRKVSRYIALNEFCRNKFIEGGLPSDRIVVKPNFVDFSRPVASGGESFLFVGRLSREKGIHVLAEALIDRPELQTRVVGAGPEARQLEGVSGAHLIGPLDGEGVRTEMCRALALVLPSICYENFPRTLVEAMGCGLPIIASRLGALPELVEEGVTGLLFEAGDGADLAEKMAWARNHPEAMRAMGETARARYEQLYSASRNYSLLMEIYADAVRQPLSFD